MTDYTTGYYQIIKWAADAVIAQSDGHPTLTEWAVSDIATQTSNALTDLTGVVISEVEDDIRAAITAINLTGEDK
jgi:hypothetical protein